MDRDSHAVSSINGGDDNADPVSPGVSTYLEGSSILSSLLATRTRDTSLNLDRYLNVHTLHVSHAVSLYPIVFCV